MGNGEVLGLDPLFLASDSGYLRIGIMENDFDDAVGPNLCFGNTIGIVFGLHHPYELNLRGKVFVHKEFFIDQLVQNL